MAIGIVKDDEFLQELNNLTVQPPARVSSNSDKGRNEGDRNVPESLRKIIGEEAVINGSSSANLLAEMLSISPSSVSAYKKGATSTSSYNEPKPEIIQHINKSRARAIKRAGKTLNSALIAITQEKLDYADAKDLAGIAKSMSGVIKDLEPQAALATETQPQFVVYAPTFRDERSFDVVHVNEVE